MLPRQPRPDIPGPEPGAPRPAARAERALARQAPASAARAWVGSAGLHLAAGAALLLALPQRAPEPPAVMPLELQLLAAPEPTATTEALAATPPLTPDSAASEVPKEEPELEEVPPEPPLAEAPPPDPLPPEPSVEPPALAAEALPVPPEPPLAEAPPPDPLPPEPPVEPPGLAAEALPAPPPAPPVPVPPRRPASPPRPTLAQSAPANAPVPLARAPAPVPAPAAVAAAPPASYVGQLFAALERHKSYPEEARYRRAQGVAMLRFRMRRDGTVIGWRIERSAGDAALDDAVTAMIQRASPLPAPPAELSGDPIELTVPVRFALR